MEEAVEDIVIAGAGLAGLATALGLHRKGVRCLVLESSPTLRASGFAFNTWTNAFRALDALGVGDKIREHHLLYERKEANFGYAFINFTTSAAAKELYCSLQNCVSKVHGSKKVIKIDQTTAG